MNKDTLKKATELDDAIEFNSMQLKIWIASTEFNMDLLNLKCVDREGDGRYSFPSVVLNMPDFFNSCRMWAIEYYKKEIKLLQEQFDNL